MDDTRAELIVAEKEFRDHIISKRFIIIFLIMLALSAYGIIKGLEDYQACLDYYKEIKNDISMNPSISELVNNLKVQMQQAEADGASVEEIQGLKAQIAQYTNPPMPSILIIFYKFNNYFIIIGAALALSMGYNLISKEREEGTLKLLLSHPLFRDSVINGKAIGSILVLTIVTIAVFILTISILLMYGLVPTFNDIIFIIGSFVNALLYCIVFLGIAIMLSTITKNSTTSILLLLGIVFIFYMITEFSQPLTQLIIGNPPDATVQANMLNATDTNGNNLNEKYLTTTTVTRQPNDKYKKYWDNSRQIYQAINIISPIFNYNIISNALISKQNPYVDTLYGSDVTILDTMSLVSINIFAIIVEIVVTFSISYVAFMRMDVR